jgi:hypothetical protein
VKRVVVSVVVECEDGVAPEAVLSDMVAILKLGKEVARTPGVAWNDARVTACEQGYAAEDE